MCLAKFPIICLFAEVPLQYGLHQLNRIAFVFNLVKAVTWFYNANEILYDNVNSKSAWNKIETIYVDHFLMSSEFRSQID